MKKIILCICVSVLTSVAVQAGEGKTCDQSKAACADKAQAATCTAKAAEAKACCDASKKTVKVLHSPRGALLAKR